MRSERGERLAKVLARGGVASRRRAEELIKAGRVRVNGAVVTDPARRVILGLDRVEVDGRQVPAAAAPVTFLLYKPAGYVSTTRDPQGRPTAVELLGRFPARLYPVGRLDLDSEGLLLLTNDGELAQLVTHPRYQVEKTYEVLVRGRPAAAALERLRRGVCLEEGHTAPARVRVLARRGPHTLLEITVHEGRKRQIKRMCLAVGHPVLRLRRTRLAFLTLAGLAPGQFRRLTPEEVQRLKAEAKARAAAIRQNES